MDIRRANGTMKEGCAQLSPRRRLSRPEDLDPPALGKSVRYDR
jgi:hypothetical protein